MNFCSDNTTGAAPEIMEAIHRANDGPAMGYGDDEVTRRVETLFAELFETDVAVFPVATGTAANALSLSLMTPSFGAVWCHSQAHIQVDECGAPEFYSGGAKLMPLDGAHGRLDAATLGDALDGTVGWDVHQVRPAVLSLSQLTECGTAYTVADVVALVELARRHDLTVHMDGARFANAVARLGCSPAELTWRAGVDVLSFGATKNGAWAAEAVVVFRRALAGEAAYRRKRAGHLLSKMRFVSAQLEAYIADGLWLRHAAHANRIATLIAGGLEGLAGVGILHPVEGNQLFVALPERVIAALRADGFSFYPWSVPGGGDADPAIRLVTAFNTREADAEALVAAIRRHIEAG